MKHASKRKKWSKQQIKVAFSVNGLCSMYPDQAGKNGETLTRKKREVGPRSTFYSFLSLGGENLKYRLGVKYELYVDGFASQVGSTVNLIGGLTWKVLECCE